MANGRRYVTRAECQSAMSKVGEDIVTVKRALVGKDMRGGLVKDVADLISKVNNINAEKQRIAKIRLEWKIAIFGALATAAAALIGLLTKG